MWKHIFTFLPLLKALEYGDSLVCDACTYELKRTHYRYAQTHIVGCLEGHFQKKQLTLGLKVSRFEQKVWFDLNLNLILSKVLIL